jgi:hypothetical protein
MKRRKARKPSRLTMIRALRSALTHLEARLESQQQTIQAQAGQLDAQRRDIMAAEQLARLRNILADILEHYGTQLPEKIDDEIRNAMYHGVAARPVRASRVRESIAAHYERIFGT